MGCATKNAKVVAISLGSLQRLIGMKAVPPSAVPLIISTAADAMSQGVDIQLRILQTILSLVTNFPEIHGQQLADALLVCFRLHESRIAVVSSTAAATAGWTTWCCATAGAASWSGSAPPPCSS